MQFLLVEATPWWGENSSLDQLEGLFCRHLCLELRTMSPTVIFVLIGANFRWLYALNWTFDVRCTWTIPVVQYLVWLYSAVRFCSMSNQRYFPRMLNCVHSLFSEFFQSSYDAFSDGRFLRRINVVVVNSILAYEFGKLGIIKFYALRSLLRGETCCD